MADSMSIDPTSSATVDTSTPGAAPTTSANDSDHTLSTVSTLTDDSDGPPSKRSPLWDELIARCSLPHAASEDWNLTYTSTPLRISTPNSHTWLDDATDSPVILGFPALVEPTGYFRQLGPYGNMKFGPSGSNPRELTARSMRSGRWSFNVSVLHPDSDEYPVQARNCSNYAFLNISNAEEKFLTELAKGDAGQQIVFNKATWHRESDATYHLKVATKFMFKNVPSDSYLKSPPIVTAKEVRDSDGVVRATPSRLRMIERSRRAQQGQSSPSRPTTQTNAANVYETEYPLDYISTDPDDDYRRLIASGKWDATRVVVPNVRDNNGALIKPNNYETYFNQVRVAWIEINVLCWTIHQATKNEPTRNVQLVLTKMQILPTAMGFKATMLVANPLPRVRSVSPTTSDPPSPSKKPRSNAQHNQEPAGKKKSTTSKYKTSHDDRKGKGRDADNAM